MAHSQATKISSVTDFSNGLLSRRKSEILLASVIIARSTSLVFSKIALGAFSPFNLLSLRFTAAFILLGMLFFIKLIRIKVKDLLRGMILGVLFTCVMAFELYGLRLSDSGTTSFIENSAMAFVPLLQLLIFRKKPEEMALIRIVLAVSGIGVLTLGRSGGFFKVGSLFLIGAAVFYAGAILATSIFSKESDPLTLGIVQVGTVGLLSSVLSGLFESPRLPQSSGEWIMILALAIVCSGFGFTLQPLAQRGTTAERAGIMCAISPLSAATLGIIFLHEDLSIFKVIGCILILMAIFIEPLLKRLRRV